MDTYDEFDPSYSNKRITEMICLSWFRTDNKAFSRVVVASLCDHKYAGFLDLKRPKIDSSEKLAVWKEVKKRN